MAISTENSRSMGKNQNAKLRHDKQTPDHILLDREGALKRLAGDETLFADLAQVFCEDGPPLLQRLTSAIEQGDREGILRSAHALRGLASNFGAEALMHPLRLIEESVRLGDLDEIPAFFDEVCYQTDRLEKELARYI